MSISLDSYRTFYFVAQYGSISRAAEALFLNQPNVTRTIKNLEEDLGCILFVRSRKGVSLTPEGDILLSYIRPAIEEILAGEETVRQWASLDAGSVRIAASEFALQQALLPVITKFRSLYPKIQMRIQSSNTPDAIAALLAKKVDFAVVSSEGECPRTLERISLLSYRDVPVCSQSLTIFENEPLTVAQLASYPFVIMRKGTSTNSLYQKYFGAHGLRIRQDIVAASSSQILPLVHAGLGIGFIPEYIANIEAPNNIRIIKTMQPLPNREISLLYRKDTPLSLAAKTFEKLILLSR